jgi:hypothetical protein
MDVAAPLALFSIWLALFLQSVKGRAVIDARDLEYEGALEGMPVTSAAHH